MKSKRNLETVLYALLAGFTVVSCNDNEVALEVNTDVVIISKRIDDVVKRAPAYYVYGNQALESASVTPPGGTTVTLEAFAGSVYSLAREPENSDFSDVPPAEGNYVFSVTGMNGETLQSQDAVDFAGLGIPQITKDTFSGTPEVLNVEWATVTGTDGYFVKLLDTTGKQVFSGYIVVSTVDEYTVSGASTSGSWTEAAVDGQTYILQVNAITFDDDATNSDNIYNISELSVAEKQIVWGEN
ncbi:MAG: hypothetical protein AB7S72_13570 [Draconibacterium sp.]